MQRLLAAHPTWTQAKAGGQTDTVVHNAERRTDMQREPRRMVLPALQYQENPSAPSSTSAPAWHPYLVGDESTSTQTKVSVDGNSDLWKVLGTPQTIEGLGEAFSVSVGDLIWLSIGVASQTDINADAASIEHGPAWDEHPNPIVLTTDDKGTYQTDYNKIIAEVVDTSDPREGLTVGTGGNAVKIIQYLKQSLLCTQWAVNGIVCLVPEEVAL